MKVAFATNIVSPYRSKLFDELRSTPGWDLRVFVDADNEFDRNWSAYGVGANRVACLSMRRQNKPSDSRNKPRQGTTHIPYGLPWALQRFAPDVVITHELGPRSAFASTWARLHRRPLVLWSYNSRACVPVGKTFRKRLRQILITKADAIIGMGRQAREVLLDLGADASKVFDAWNAPDHEGLDARLRSSSGSARRQSIGLRIGRDRFALVSGRLVEHKGIDEVLATWREAQTSGWKLVFCGEGPLEERVASAGEDVLGVGYIPPDKMADWYAAADLHIFASLGEPWGLAVNESMWCGTPTLCSRYAGCADDMITHGDDGWIWDPLDLKTRRAALETAMLESGSLEMRMRAAITARRFTIPAMADGFRAAVDLALTRASRS